MDEEMDEVGVKLWNEGLTPFYRGRIDSPELRENDQEKSPDGN